MTKPEQNSLICGDCLSIMRTWRNNSVDLVFGSPPYQDARDVKSDPFPVFKHPEDWTRWMVQVVRESLRVCRGLVAFVVQGRTRNYSWSGTPALLMADLIRGGITLRDPLIYHRVGIAGSGGPDWLRHDCEFIICATSGGKLPWSDNTAMGHPPKWGPGGEMSHRLSDGARVNQWGGSEGKKIYGRNHDGSIDTRKRPSHKYSSKNQWGHSINSGATYKDERGRVRSKGKRPSHKYDAPVKANPGNLVSLKVGGGLMGSKHAHENEAPFPESLASFIIRSFCKPRGIVCDPFGGSFTTCAAAEKLGRSWIGIDIRESQVAIGRKRLEEIEQ